ncbi:MAG: CoA-binding protein [Cryomorphaceae bacterium]|nr:CoA-binding protein [Cryomorphaceae bacterium]
MGKTAIIGASSNPSRYSYIATRRLADAGEQVYPVGLKAGKIGEIDILDGMPALADIDTVTLYVGPAHQPYWTDYILSLKPQRVIFNPGTENQELYTILEKHGIRSEVACTLVLLSLNSYSL